MFYYLWADDCTSQPTNQQGLFQKLLKQSFFTRKLQVFRLCQSLETQTPLLHIPCREWAASFLVLLPFLTQAVRPPQYVSPWPIISTAFVGFFAAHLMGLAASFQVGREQTPTSKVFTSKVTCKNHTLLQRRSPIEYLSWKNKTSKAPTAAINPKENLSLCSGCLKDICA